MVTASRLARLLVLLILLPGILVENSSPSVLASTTQSPVTISGPSAISSQNSAIKPTPDPVLMPYTINLPLVKHTLFSESCHFAIGAPYGIQGYNISELGVGSLLDWNSHRITTLAPNIDYLPILRLDDKSFKGTLSNLPKYIARNPAGATWIIGNEPDSEVLYQDHVTAEKYAERYFALASVIRASDSSALIGFGAVIQPTPIRLYYLDQVMKRLSQLAGGMDKALALIDVYTFHAFILNEEQIYNPIKKSWGAGWPLGYNPNTWPAPEIISITPGNDETWKTHSIQIYKDRVITIRKWMQKYGETDKPLWITEYGSLLPSTPGDSFRVSQADAIAFMNDSFDFMLGYRDPNLGYAKDENRMVQLFVWYSLNEDLEKFGGSLYDPKNHDITPLGKTFTNYDPPADIVAVTNPDVYLDASYFSIKLSSVSGDPYQMKYQISVKAGNYVSSDRRTGVKVDYYLDGNWVGSTQSSTPRCAGQADVSFEVSNLLSGSTHAFSARISVLPDNGNDQVARNNEVAFPSIQIPGAKRLFLPYLNH